jgi:hypothetical protein
MRAFRVIAVAAGLLGLATGSAGAQALPAAKVAFVNVRAVLSGTPEYAKAESLFAKEIEGYRAASCWIRSSPRSASSSRRCGPKAGTP